jgi:hypothetical protein
VLQVKRFFLIAISIFAPVIGIFLWTYLNFHLKILSEFGFYVILITFPAIGSLSLFNVFSKKGTALIASVLYFGLAGLLQFLGGIFLSCIFYSDCL